MPHGAGNPAPPRCGAAGYRGRFLQRLPAHPPVRNPEYAATWLTRILINACIKQLRHEKRTLPLAAAPEPAGSDGQGAVDLRDAVARLPSDLCVAVSVRYFGGMTVAETAGVLGLPEGTVKTRLRRALSILRLELEV